LLLLGSGSLETEIQNRIALGGAEHQVHFAGQVEFARLPEMYRAADLYVSASHSDGSSVSLLEALACGLPALVSDIPGNRDWVEPEVNGWWFRDGSGKDLARLLRHAVSQAANLPAMGRSSRRVAETRADWTQNFARLAEAYGLAFRETGR
ncbi:MAG TPA: glycosyltransferase, partial [Anaerolineales bacterium]|nr:glycosyltransferase [Anaerolineales bacterium]